MTAFNQVCYSFSPTVADWERQNPSFKQVVRIAITPFLATMSILNHVNVDSEQEMASYGIGVILLNVGIYVGIPITIWKKNDFIKGMIKR